MTEKEKFQLEYTLNSSPKVLFNRLSTPAGLSEWFAEDVNIESNSEIFVFLWDGSEHKARIVAKKDLKYIRFRWIVEEEENENDFFEFRINVDELTSEVALVITDFAYPSDKADSINLWDTQIADLKHVLGSM